MTAQVARCNGQSVIRFHVIDLRIAASFALSSKMAFTMLLAVSVAMLLVMSVVMSFLMLILFSVQGGTNRELQGFHTSARLPRCGCHSESTSGTTSQPTSGTTARRTAGTTARTPSQGAILHIGVEQIATQRIDAPGGLLLIQAQCEATASS